MKNYHS